VVACKKTLLTYLSINLKELKQDINSKAHTVTNICGVRRRITRELLPMFFVELKPVANNKDIYKINYLLVTFYFLYTK